MKKFSSTMKASSRRASRNKRVARIVLTGVIAIAVLFLIPRTIGWVASLVMSPVVAIERWFTESGASLPSYLRDRQTLLNVQESLEQDLAAQSGSKQTIERLQLENTELRALLGATTTERIAAGVIAQPTNTPYDSLVIDRGSEDGITLNAPVFTGHDQVIGYVAAVYPGSAVVVLATTPGLESTVYIIGPDIYTTAVGRGGGTLLVGVPQGVPLELDDLVVLPSLEAGVYGQIIAIDTLDTRSEQYGFVTTSVPIQSVRWVSVGVDSLEPLSFEEAKLVVDGVKSDLTTVPVPEGVLVELPEETASSSATSTATSTIETEE